MNNKIAPEGYIFVCAACGKKSKDIFGHQKIDKGWDESCMLSAVLCHEKPRDDGLYKQADEAEVLKDDS